MLTDRALKWLSKRKLDAEAADRHGLSSVKRGAGEWIEIPFKREGKIVNRKFRRIDKKEFSQDKGGTRCAWNEDCLRDSSLDGPLLITEGELDALAAIQTGHLRTISAPAAPPETHQDKPGARFYAWVDDIVPMIKDVKEIILGCDADDAGARLLHDLSRRLGRGRCKFLQYPVDCKDLGDALQKFGDKGVAATLSRATLLEMPGIKRFSQLAPARPLEVTRAPLTPEFSEHIAFCRGHLSVWTGVPNHGKSTVLNAACMELIKQARWKVAHLMFEVEPNPNGGFHRDVARYLAGKHLDDIDEADMKAAADFIEANFLLFDVDQTGAAITLDWVLDHAERAVTQFGADMLVVDPWSRLDHERDDLTEHDYTQVCLKTFQKFARRYNVHVAIVAHPRKLDKRGNSYMPPSGYDISGSAHWFNACEVGITVHRGDKKKGDCTKIIVWKSKRVQEMGPTGTFFMRMQPSGRFEEWFDPKESEAA